MAVVDHVKNRFVKVLCKNAESFSLPFDSLLMDSIDLSVRPSVDLPQLPPHSAGCGKAVNCSPCKGLKVSGCCAGSGGGRGCVRCC